VINSENSFYVRYADARRRRLRVLPATTPRSSGSITSAAAAVVEQIELGYRWKHRNVTSPPRRSEPARHINSNPQATEADGTTPYYPIRSTT